MTILDKWKSLVAKLGIEVEHRHELSRTVDEVGRWRDDSLHIAMFGVFVLYWLWRVLDYFGISFTQI